MSRLLLGFVLALAYMVGTIVVSGALSSRPEPEQLVEIGFSDCIVEDMPGRYVGIRFHRSVPASVATAQAIATPTPVPTGVGSEPACSLVTWETPTATP